MSSPLYTLSKGASSLDLLASPYLATSMYPGNVPRSIALEGGGPTDDLPQVGYISMSGERRIPLSVEVWGTTGDSCEANVRALIDMLPKVRGETSTLSIRRADGTNTCKATVLAVENLNCDYEHVRHVRYRALLTCDLICQPYLYSASAQTLYNAHTFALPAVVDLTAQIGQYRAPLDIAVTASGGGLARVFAGLYADATAAIGLFVRKAVDLAWSGGAAAADAAGYPDGVGNTVWGSNAAAGVYADIDDTAMAPGEYLIVANCKATTANHAYAAVGGLDWVAIPSTSLDLLVLGIVTLPYKTVRSGGASALRVYLQGDGSTNYAYLNYVALLPCPVLGWKKASGGATTVRVENGLFYVDNIADLSDLVGARQVSALGGELVMLGTTTTPAPTRNLDVSISATARWEQFPA